MIKNLIKELFYLAKFKTAIQKTNLVAAAKYLDKHKEASDLTEAKLSKIMNNAKEEISLQKSIIDNLTNKLN
jgi:hypothetical protein